MGPANDYWPADLGGTRRTRLVRVPMRVCVSCVCVCVCERQGPRLALAVPRRPHETLLLRTFWTFSSAVALAQDARFFRNFAGEISRTDLETKRIIVREDGS